MEIGTLREVLLGINHIYIIAPGILVCTTGYALTD
ncbi:hypothetical protein ANO14919_123230 [Xylariales sp. No.14919]|nr:hypothetical protein ANO14919_123230 [Xylariales sp. No.14919]